MFTERGFPDEACGYPWAMSPIETFIDEVGVLITDAVDTLDVAETARLYAEVLDVEQRLDALRVALDRPRSRPFLTIPDKSWQNAAA